MRGGGSRFFTAAGSLIVAAALAGCSTARSSETPSEGEGTADAGVPVRIQSAGAESRRQTTAASGVVEARHTVDLAFQVGGKVAAVGPDEGDVVRAGSLLARIDPIDYQLALRQAAAQAEHARQERERYRPLVGAGSVAPNDYDRLESAARQTAAAADLAGKRLADTRLVSPIAGVVARRAIDPGETAAPGQSVFTVMDVDPVRVRIGVPEAEVGMVRVGQPATVRVAALAGETFGGRVALVGVAADSTTRTYSVEISLPNPARRLRVGMVAEATIEGDRRRSAVTVPAAAVVRDADGATVVYVLDEGGGRAHARRVEVGAPRGDEVEIARGLAAGEPVVVAGQHRLRDGARVLVQTVADASSATPLEIQHGGAR